MHRSITLVGVDGLRVELGTQPYYVGESPALWGAPPVTFEETAHTSPGSVITSVRHQARDAVLPIFVVADSVTEFDFHLRRLMQLINAPSGQVRVVVSTTDDDGLVVDSRELVAHAIGGFENLAYARPDSTEIVVPIRLRASNPYWRSTQEDEVPVEAGSPSVTTGSLAYDIDLPYDINRPYDGITTMLNIVNVPVITDGDAVSWPRFQITGPASSIEVVNERTAQRWLFADLIDAGQTLVVDTEPGRRMIMVDGKPKFTAMGEDWQWWGLLPGYNPVSVHLSDYEESTSVTFFYRNQWLMA